MPIFGSVLGCPDWEDPETGEVHRTTIQTEFKFI